jgi:arylamine N-acetyltransferase
MEVPFHWRMFMKRYGLPLPGAEGTSALLLEEIAAAFSNVPFENATQINHLFEAGPEPEPASALVTQHLIHGTGGICYALVDALKELLDLYGFQSALHHGRVGDYEGRRYRANHCAITVDLHRRRFLLDPGMLLKKPLLLIDETGVPSVYASHREADLLVERNAHDHLSVMIRSHRGFSHTFMIDLKEATPSDFAHAWRRSFDPLIPADYLLVHKIIDGTLWMIRDHQLLSRGADGRTTAHEATWPEIGDRFGIDAPILERAWHRTKYASVRYRVGYEIARAARTTMSVVRSMSAAMEAAVKRAA